MFDDDVDEAEEENRGPSVEFLAKGWKRERISHLGHACFPRVVVVEKVRPRG